MRLYEKTIFIRFFDMNIIYKIINYLNILRYRGLKEKKHYSRWGEDLFLINYFKDIPNGRYLDVGAFHPFRGSNTFLLVVIFEALIF